MTKENIKQPEEPTANVWAGTQEGILKSVCFQKETAKNHFQDKEYGAKFEIKSMCWDCNDKTKIHMSLKSGVVKTYDNAKSKFEQSVLIPDLEKSDAVCNLQKLNEKFVVGVSSGKVIMWDPSKEDHTTISTGNHLHCVATSSVPNSSRIATGGKETVVKIWDVENLDKPIFAAKNVKPDFLDLRRPLDVRRVHFLDDSQDKILTTTGYSNIRIYDLNSKRRRPVLETKYSEFPIISSSMVARLPNQVFVGNTTGEVASFDTRMFKHVLKGYKGCNGSVRYLENHPTLPYLFSCGLDRYLRVHDEESRILKKKIYLKSKLNCLLVTDSKFVKTEEKAVKGKKGKTVEESDEEEEEGEDMWDELEDLEDSDNGSESGSDSCEEIDQPEKKRLRKC